MRTRGIRSGPGRGGAAALAAVLLCLPAAAADDPPVLDGEQLRAAVVGATDWLIENQRPDGGWGSHHSPRPIEVLCDVPGSHQAFRVGTTGLAVLALMDTPAQSKAAREAVDRGIDHLLEYSEAKRPSGFEHYNVWAFGFALHAFGEFLASHPDDPRSEEILATCARLVEKLERYQCLDGGWGYLSLEPPTTYQPSFTSMSFTTATILVGLDRARSVGVELPPRLLERALDSVARCRTPTGSYTYGEIWNRGPTRGINQIKGAACRTPVCQYALELFGREIPLEDHRRALQDLLVRHARFQVASLRRPIPHESWYAISGYFYLYGHAYAGYVLEGLPPAERRRASPAVFQALEHCRQPDGSYWDYPLYSYHKPYGTAFALMALSRLEVPEE